MSNVFAMDIIYWTLEIGYLDVTGVLLAYALVCAELVWLHDREILPLSDTDTLL